MDGLGRWCKKCDPGGTGPCKSSDEMKPGRNVCIACYNEDMRQRNSRRSAEDIQKWNSKRSAEDRQKDNAKRSAEAIQKYNAKRTVEDRQKDNAKNNPKRVLGSSRKEKEEWEQILRCYGPPSDYDPNESDFGANPSSNDSEEELRWIEEEQAMLEQEEELDSNDDSSDDSSADGSTSSNEENPQGRKSTRPRSHLKKDTKVQRVLCTTTANHYPTPPWVCNCKRCARGDGEGLTEYCLRVEKMWKDLLPPFEQSGFLFQGDILTCELLEFLSIYLKSKWRVSDDLIGEAEERFLSLAQATKPFYRNFRFFTTTAKVAAAVVAFRNCTAAKKYKSIRAGTTVRLGFMSTVKEMQAAEDEKAEEYGAMCWASVNVSFVRCVRGIYSHADASESDICATFDREVAWATTEELLLQLLTTIGDRREEILFLLADSFDQHLGPRHPLTLRLWILAFAVVDFDCSKHYALCLYENNTLLRLNDDRAELQELWDCMNNQHFRPVGSKVDISRRALGAIFRCELMARLRSHITYVYGRNGSPEASALVHLCMIACMIFEAEAERVVGLQTYARVCERCRLRGCVCEDHFMRSGGRQS